MRRRVWRGGGAAVALVMVVVALGCGGGMLSSLEPEPPSAPERSAGLTAHFRVDVASRQVSITSLPGPARSRAVFSGTAVGFESSLLLDQPGNTGRKALEVALVNHSGERLGQMPDGTPTGLRVVFGPISNVGAFTDLRPRVEVETVAGSGVAGWVDGPVGAASFNGPYAVAVDEEERIYVADYYNHRIRQIAGGLVSTLAGSGVAGSVDGLGSAARFNGPSGIACHPLDGALIVVEYAGNRVRRVTEDGRVTTVAGTGVAGGTNGAGDVAQFDGPQGVAVDEEGVIYVTEVNGHRVRRIVLTGGDPRQASSYTVSLLAGDGVAGSTDGVGTGARFKQPRGIAVGWDGAVYVADLGNHKLRRVSEAGEVVTIAGTGTAGTTDGVGTGATFNGPWGIVMLPDRGLGPALVVSDSSGQTLRQVWLLAEGSAAPGSTGSWRVQTLAGLGGTAGDVDGEGTAARLNSPRGLAVDGSGNVYLTDTNNRKVKRLRAMQGFFPLGIETGSAPTEKVQLANADGVRPAPSGEVRPYLSYPQVLGAGAQSEAREWWFVVPDGVTAFEFEVTVEAATAGLAPPEAVDGTLSGGVGSPQVMVTTLAGSTTGTFGFNDGLPTLARFNAIGLTVDGEGHVYVADAVNHAIRRVGADGVVTTVAGVVGVGFGWTDGPGTQAQFNNPEGIAVSPDGLVLYVADLGNHVIRRLERVAWSDPTNAENWTVSTIAGTGTAGYANGVGSSAQFNGPWGIGLDAGGHLYVTEYSGNRVRRLWHRGGDPSLATNWWISLVAGDPGGASGTTDGVGAAARFDGPAGIAVDRSGVLYVADANNHRIRKITDAGGSSGGTVTTLAGSVAGYADGVGAAAQFDSPIGIAADTAGWIYVSDCNNHRVRRLSPQGQVTTVAGTGVAGIADGPGDTAQLNRPMGLALDATGTLYVMDGYATCVRRIDRIISVGYLGGTGLDGEGSLLVGAS